MALRFASGSRRIRWTLSSANTGVVTFTHGIVDQNGSARTPTEFFAMRNANTTVNAQIALAHVSSTVIVAQLISHLAATSYQNGRVFCSRPHSFIG